MVPLNKACVLSLLEFLLDLIDFNFGIFMAMVSGILKTIDDIFSTCLGVFNAQITLKFSFIFFQRSQTSELGF